MDAKDRFYDDLPVAEDFSHALSGESYRSAPENWIVAMTDVVDSTKAIEEGRYKDVTIAGAVGTIALANLTGNLDFPFLFGGDGMVFLLPGSYREPALDVLADTIRAVRDLSGLELRAAVIPVSKLYAAGAELLVGKLRVSEKYTQAMLSGSALEYADELLKGRRKGTIEFAREERIEGATYRADYRGFSCRWLDIPSEHGETLSLIVRPLSPTNSAAMRDLQAVSELLKHAAHPLSVDLQRLGGPKATGVRAEARFRSRSRGGVSYLFHYLMIRFEMLAVYLSIRFNLPLRGMGKQLSQIPEDNITNADVRKFDGTLKMTVALSRQQREELLEKLDRLEGEGRIVYGAHVSDRAIMTCLIHTNLEDEVHFVDAADGGYALAARRMKQKLYGFSS